MSQIGKRYECTSCGTTVLCLRPSSSELQCCALVMGEMTMEQLPSGD